MNAKAATYDTEHHAPGSQTVPFAGLVKPMLYAGEEVASVISDGAGFVRRSYEAWRRRRAVRATVKALAGLDDHVLEDIGVYRDEIETVARSVAENPGSDHRQFSRR